MLIYYPQPLQHQLQIHMLIQVQMVLHNLLRKAKVARIMENREYNYRKVSFQKLFEIIAFVALMKRGVSMGQG